jgi:hypothetical protein
MPPFGTPPFAFAGPGLVPGAMGATGFGRVAALGSRVAAAIRRNRASLDVPIAASLSPFLVAVTAAAAAMRICFALMPGKKPFATTTPPSVRVFLAKSSSRSFFDPKP